MIRGPRLKIVRRLGTPLPGLTRKDAARKPFPPGQHGPNGSRRRKSAYRLQLEEKQKVRAHYGVTETQLRRAMADAAGQPGVTGVLMLVSLERRLDNVVFRLGLAPTIPAARQLIVHRHVRVNAQRVDKAAFITERGQVIALAEGIRGSAAALGALKRGPALKLPSYLQLVPDDRFTGRVIGTPARADIPILVNEAAEVEFYAR